MVGSLRLHICRWETFGEIEGKRQKGVLAYGNGCSYCQAKGTPLKPEDMKESYAIAFAEVFLLQREKTEEKFFQVLREVFSDEEISELLAFICFTTAQQYFRALMDLK